MKQYEKFSAPLLRIAMSLVFLYFGFQQITAPEEWIGFVPDFALVFGISAKSFVVFNSLFELLFGVLLLAGLFTRVSAFLLTLHIFGIAFSIGFNELGVRDFGLAFATLVVFLNGIDQWCLDRKFRKNGR